MAKLNGVTTLDMNNGEITKIAYVGAEYTKVGSLRQAEVGDILRPLNRSLDVTGEAYYKVTGTSDRAVAFIDDKSYNGFSFDYPFVTVFRKSTQSALKVSAPFAEMLTSKVDAVERRVSALEGVKDESAELAVNMRVKAIRDGQFHRIKEGMVGRITNTGETYQLNDPYSVRVVFGIRIDYFRPQDLEVYTVEETLEVGDYALITGKGDRGDFSSHRFDIGEVVKIVGDAPQNDRMKAEHLDRSDYWYVYNGYMRKATDAEVAEATQPPKPTVGDIVVITGKSEFESQGSANSVGDIGKIAGEGDRGRSFSVEVPGKRRDGNHTSKKEIRLATDAEKAEYEKAVEQAELDAVFTKAGRKPNEYRKGDIAKITLKDGKPINFIGFVEDVAGTISIGVRGNTGYKGAHFSEGDTAEIVCFAEDRKDITKGGR